MSMRRFIIIIGIILSYIPISTMHKPILQEIFPAHDFGNFLVTPRYTYETPLDELKVSFLCGQLDNTVMQRLVSPDEYCALLAMKKSFTHNQLAPSEQTAVNEWQQRLKTKHEKFLTQTTEYTPALTRAGTIIISRNTD